MDFEEKGKPEQPEKNLSEQGRDPTTNKELVLRRRENLSTRRKTSQSKGENQQQTQPTYMWSTPGFEPRATLEESVPNSAPTLLPIPIPTLAPSYWHRGNHFGFQERGYYSFRPPPHPLRMFFTAFFIFRILQQYTTGFIKELTKITVPEKS